MSFITIKWRQFKATLTSIYIYGKYKGKPPCENIEFDEETWAQFVQSREDSSWQVCFYFSKSKLN